MRNAGMHCMHCMHCMERNAPNAHVLQVYEVAGMFLQGTCDVSDATAFLNAAPSVAISLSKART